MAETDAYYNYTKGVDSPDNQILCVSTDNLKLPETFTWNNISSTESTDNPLALNSLSNGFHMLTCDSSMGIRVDIFIQGRYYSYKTSCIML